MPFTSHTGLNSRKHLLHGKFLQNVLLRKHAEEDTSTSNRVLNAWNFANVQDSANIQ